MGTTNDEPDRLVHLEQQMGALLRRLEALEHDVGGTLSEPPPEEGNVQGTLAYSGSFRLGKQRLKLMQRVSLSEALEAEPESVSRVFAALGSPFRILLLRALLEGPRTSQELQQVLDVGPVGQLYHHLKELLAAGLIWQRKRSLYAIRQDRLMAVCIVFATAPHLVSDQGATSPIAETEEGDERREPDGPA